MGKIKKLYTLLTLALILSVSVSIMNMSTTNAESTASEKALSIITNVAKIDLAEYNVTTGDNTVTYPSDLGGFAKVDGGYILNSNTSKIEVLYVLVNNEISYYNLHSIKGSPLLKGQLSSNLIVRTSDFLDSYQSNLEASDFLLFKEMLSKVTEIKNTSMTIGNTRFEITLFSQSTRFRWVNTFDGADYTSFGISYRMNSIDFAFGNDRYNKIGNTSVSITRDQAISIAKARTQNLSWNVNISDTSVTQVSNVTILDDHTNAQLLTAPKEPLVLHPYWRVSLTFDKVYPGYVYGVSYSIWADTGEVFYGNLNTLGGPPTSDTPTTSNPTTSTDQYSQTGQTPTTETKPSSENLPAATPTPMLNSSPVPPSEVKQQPSPFISPEYGYVIAALIVTIILVASFIIYRRRK